MTDSPNATPRQSPRPAWVLPIILCGCLPSLLIAAIAVYLVAFGASRKTAPTTASMPPPIPTQPSPTQPSPIQTNSGEISSLATDPKSPDAEKLPSGFPFKPPGASATADRNAKLRSTIVIWVSALSKRIEACDFDRETGKLAMIGPWEKELGILSLRGVQNSADEAKLNRIPLAGRPHEIWQQSTELNSIFAVSEFDSNGVHIIDVQSEEIIKAINLNNKLASFVPAVGPAKPYLYITTSDRRGDSRLFRTRDGSFFMSPSAEIEIQRLNLDSMQLEEPLRIRHLDRQGHAISGETRLYYWAQSVRLKLSHDGRYGLLSDRVIDPDSRTVLTKLPGPAYEFIKDRPWVVGIAGNELVVYSINNGDIIRRARLPEQPYRNAQVFFDKIADRYVVCLDTRVAIVPTSQFKLPDGEPNILFQQPPPTVAKLGVPYVFPLRTISGEAAVELLEGPEGMSIRGDTLHWLPETGYQGAVDVKIKVSRESTSREHSWSITVE